MEYRCPWPGTGVEVENSRASGGYRGGLYNQLIAEETPRRNQEVGAADKFENKSGLTYVRCRGYDGKRVDARETSPYLLRAYPSFHHP